MKLKILFTIASIFCVPSVFAQGSNCSFIQNSLTGDTKNVGTSCDVHFNQTVTESQTYNVQCVDQTNNNNVYVNTSSQMTSTGTTSLFCGGPSKIDCSPTFQPENQNAGFTSSTDNINRFFLRVWARASDSQGLSCLQLSMSQDLKQCAAQPCAPTPTPSPTPPPTSCTAPPGSHFRSDQTGDNTDPSNCSPIIIDLTGDGFFLTSAMDGVKFDIANTGIPLQVAWTTNANNAWLVLDRNQNGVINSGAELFGNFTSQPSSSHPNGFAALAVYDDPMNGGNGDGVIDASDKIFASLRLWVDANHDGISQPGELHTLPEMGIYSISLDYVLSERKDEYGNLFRYRARVNQGLHGSPDIGKIAYDVFLVAQ